MSRDNIKISVIGTGRMGFFHTRLLSRLGLLNSVADANPERAKELGEKYSIPYYTNYEELMDKEQPDGVILAVPTSVHHKIAIRLLNDYKDVLKAILIEKPVATTIDYGLKVKEAVVKSNIPTIIGHIEVYNPTITKIRSIMEQKLIGDPRSALFQRRGAVDESRLESIGDVYEDIGVHDFDIALKLFLGNELRIYSVARKLREVDNSSVVVIKDIKTDVFCTFMISREFAGKVRTLDVEGSKGTVRADTLTQMIELRSLSIARGGNDNASIRVPFANGEQIKVYGEPLLQEIWNLVDCIKGHDKPKVTIDDGLNTMRIVETVRESIKRQEPVNLKLI